MPNIKLHIKYSKNIKTVISTRDLLDLYFYGIDVRAKDGSNLPQHVYLSAIMSAQDEIEKFLGIKILRQIVEEKQHYYGSDWINWGTMQTSFMVNEALAMTGFYGSQKHIQVPSTWLVVKKSSHDLFSRGIWLIPNGTGSIQSSPVFGGTPPYFSMGNSVAVPDYWLVRYLTGFNKLPMDLVNIIGKLAAINIFNILGDLVLGAGISSQSIGVDGLSQSITTTNVAGKAAYNARITMYLADLKEAIPRLKEFYTGIKFTCV